MYNTCCQHSNRDRPWPTAWFVKAAYNWGRKGQFDSHCHPEDILGLKESLNSDQSGSVIY